MQTAVITGSSSGIGKALTLSLLRKDFKIYGVSRTDPQIDHSHFHWLKIDLTNPQEIQQLKNKIVETRVDVLVNNAGTAFGKLALDFSTSSFNDIFNLNFKAPILVASQLIEKLKNGLIINISSLSDRIPEEEFALYCSSKAALNMYFDVVALEHKEVKIINILPDCVDTPLLRKIETSETFHWDEILQPQQIADFTSELIDNNKQLPSGVRIAFINEAQKKTLEYHEELWVYNVDSKKLIKMK